MVVSGCGGSGTGGGESRRRSRSHSLGSCGSDSSSHSDGSSSSPKARRDDALESLGVPLPFSFSFSSVGKPSGMERTMLARNESAGMVDALLQMQDVLEMLARSDGLSRYPAYSSWYGRYLYVLVVILSLGWMVGFSLREREREIV